MAFELLFLGTGTSAGIPMIGSDEGACSSDDPRDTRDRASVLIRWPDEQVARLPQHEQAAAFNAAQANHRQILVDASPDLRYQAIRNRLSRLDAVFYTHAHADHIFGTDDLRRFNAVSGQALDIYADANTFKTLSRIFSYIFEPHRNVNKSFVADLIPHNLQHGKAIELHGSTWTPIPLLHGRLPILGFRVDYKDHSIAYCTDMSTLPPEAYPLLQDLDVLVVDGLRQRHHPTHQTIDRACELIHELQPTQAYLTHMSFEVIHAEVDDALPDGINLAHDGLSVKLGE